MRKSLTSLTVCLSASGRLEKLRQPYPVGLCRLWWTTCRNHSDTIFWESFSQCVTAYASEEWGFAWGSRYRWSDGIMAEGTTGRLRGRTLSAPALADTGGTVGRCNGGAAGHQGEMEGVWGPVEQEEYVPWLLQSPKPSAIVGMSRRNQETVPMRCLFCTCHIIPNYVAGTIIFSITLSYRNWYASCGLKGQNMECSRFM